MDGKFLRVGLVVGNLEEFKNGMEANRKTAEKGLTNWLRLFPGWW